MNYYLLILLFSILLLFGFDFKDVKIIDVKILSNEKNYFPKGYDKYSQEYCENWKYLNNEQVKLILIHSDSIVGEERHQSFDYYPCENKGKVIIQKDTFNFIINAGGTSFLYNDNKEILLGYKDSIYSDYFISTVVSAADEE